MTTRERRIIDYMQEHGAITRVNAYMECGVFELSSLLLGLEERGGKPL